MVNEKIQELTDIITRQEQEVTMIEPLRLGEDFFPALSDVLGREINIENFDAEIPFIRENLPKRSREEVQPLIAVLDGFTNIEQYEDGLGVKPEVIRNIVESTRLEPEAKEVPGAVVAATGGMTNDSAAIEDTLTVVETGSTTVGTTAVTGSAVVNDRAPFTGAEPLPITGPVELPAANNHEPSPVIADSSPALVATVVPASLPAEEVSGAQPLERGTPPLPTAPEEEYPTALESLVLPDINSLPVPPPPLPQELPAVMEERKEPASAPAKEPEPAPAPAKEPDPEPAPTKDPEPAPTPVEEPDPVPAPKEPEPADLSKLDVSVLKDGKINDKHILETLLGKKLEGDKEYSIASAEETRLQQAIAGGNHEEAKTAAQAAMATAQVFDLNVARLRNAARELNDRKIENDESAVLTIVEIAKGKGAELPKTDAALDGKEIIFARSSLENVARELAGKIQRNEELDRDYLQYVDNSIRSAVAKSVREKE